MQRPRLRLQGHRRRSLKRSSRQLPQAFEVWANQLRFTRYVQRCHSCLRQGASSAKASNRCGDTCQGVLARARGRVCECAHASVCVCVSNSVSKSLSVGCRGLECSTEVSSQRRHFCVCSANVPAWRTWGELLQLAAIQNPCLKL